MHVCVCIGDQATNRIECALCIEGTRLVNQKVNHGNAKDICVIVPAYEAAHYLEVSLPPLIALRDAGHVEDVIVVDLWSTPLRCACGNF